MGPVWKRSHFIIDLKEVGKSCGRQGANSPEGQNSKCKGPAAGWRRIKDWLEWHEDGGAHG